MRELKILKGVKKLGLQNNGHLPVIVSAKICSNIGEILMTHVGKSIYEVFKIDESIHDF
jgi:hypothetical protein